MKIQLEIPLEYRLALDAAASILCDVGTPLIIYSPPVLEQEITQRLPVPSERENDPYEALWVDPQVGSWQENLNAIAIGLKAEAACVVVLSQKLARLLPKRKGWQDLPLGWQLGGIYRLKRAFQKAGFTLESGCGFHSVFSIFLNSLSQIAARTGRLDWEDRLLAAGRNHYLTHRWPGFATVSILVFRKS